MPPFCNGETESRSTLQNLESCDTNISMNGPIVCQGKYKCTQNYSSLNTNFKDFSHFPCFLSAGLLPLRSIHGILGVFLS